MKRLLKKLLSSRKTKEFAYATLCALGVDHRFRKYFADRLLIVMYHGLVEDHSPSPPSWLLLSVSRFEAQMHYLKSNYDVISVGEALQRMQEGRPFTRPTACITFDDGYRNNYTLGWPILRRHGLPATIYLASDFIDTDRVIWTIRLERMLLMGNGTLDLSDFDLGEYSLNPALRCSWECSCDRLKGALYRMAEESREEVLEAISRRLGLGDLGAFSDFLPMTWSDARRMAEEGLVEFGGHTANHVVVSALGDEAQEDEIRQSMTTLEREIGVPPLSFAYPNGSEEDFDDRAKAVVRETSALGALSTIEGLNSPGEDMYALKRISVGGEMTLSRFRLLASGFIPMMRRCLLNR
ncbi:MAG: polysaccharide deacetylase family protein [Planctomycetota bacterium]